MSYMEARRREMEAYCRREYEERRTFMDQLNLSRELESKDYRKQAKKLIGPNWYQAFSPRQREVLDQLDREIYKDVLEDRAKRTRRIVDILGVFPVPSERSLMMCIFLGDKKAINFMAELFKLLYDHPVQIKRPSYPLNARLLMSAICYLGMDEVIRYLTLKFYHKPELISGPPKPKRKKRPVLESPYLERFVLRQIEDNGLNNKNLKGSIQTRRLLPPSLPSVTDLMTLPIEESEKLQSKKFQPQPPPLPPPPLLKDRVQNRICDKIAGLTLNTHEEENVTYTMTIKKESETKITRGKGYKLKENSQKFGITVGRMMNRYKKTHLVPLPFKDLHYIIGGIAIVNGKAIYIINGINIEKGPYNRLHNGVKLIEGVSHTIHGGLIPCNNHQTTHCNCLNMYEQIIKHLAESKCRCGHYYDYYAEGKLEKGPVYFTPPSAHSPYTFHYDQIYQLDEKANFVDSLIDELVYKDSLIGFKSVEKKEPRKPIIVPQTKCLSDNPTPKEYLKCTLKTVQNIYLLASLPDAHLVPELLEWMRHRIYGKITPEEHKKYMLKSKNFWNMIKNITIAGWGRVKVPPMPYKKHVTLNWFYKNKVRSNYNEQILKNFRRKVFLSHATQYNLLWPTMFQDVYPSKRFRQIFFDYIGTKQDHYFIINPYSNVEAAFRRNEMNKRRISCCLEKD